MQERRSHCRRRTRRRGERRRSARRRRRLRRRRSRSGRACSSRRRGRSRSRHPRRGRARRSGARRDHLWNQHNHLNAANHTRVRVFTLAHSLVFHHIFVAAGSSCRVGRGANPYRLRRSPSLRVKANRPRAGEVARSHSDLYVTVAVDTNSSYVIINDVRVILRLRGKPRANNYQ